jgi:hypothetical protein
MSKVSKTHLWSFPGMKEIPLPKPVKCPYCGKKLNWRVSDIQYEYQTESHHEFIGKHKSLISHGFSMHIPRYE